MDNLVRQIIVEECDDAIQSDTTWFLLFFGYILEEIIHESMTHSLISMQLIFYVARFELLFQLINRLDIW